MPGGPIARKPPSFQPPVRNAHIAKLLAKDQAYVIVMKLAVEWLRWSALAVVAATAIALATRWIEPKKTRDGRDFTILLAIVSSILQALGAWKLTSYTPQDMRSSGHEFTRWLVRVAGIAAL